MKGCADKKGERGRRGPERERERVKGREGRKWEMAAEMEEEDLLEGELGKMF